jgi:hypothetical protein
MAQIEPHPWTDPIIEEVRAVREAIAARYDYDVEKLAAALAERSKVAGRGIASPAAADASAEAEPLAHPSQGPCSASIEAEGEIRADDGLPRDTGSSAAANGDDDSGEEL